MDKDKLQNNLWMLEARIALLEDLCSTLVMGLMPNPTRTEESFTWELQSIQATQRNDIEAVCTWSHTEVVTGHEWHSRWRQMWEKEQELVSLIKQEPYRGEEIPF